LPKGRGVITVVHREFSARQATGSFSQSVQAAGLRGLRQPLNPAAALSLARRMPPGNPCLCDRVTDVVLSEDLSVCPRGGGDYGRAPEVFRPPGDGSFSLSVQAAGLRGSRQPLNNPGGRQPSLFLRHSLRPDGPSGCAVPGAAVLCAASLPRRPGLRSLLSAPDAGRKTPACQSWFLLKAGVVCSECVQWDSKKVFINRH